VIEYLVLAGFSDFGNVSESAKAAALHAAFSTLATQPDAVSAQSTLV
jgi:hypothetical protein